MTNLYIFENVDRISDSWHNDGGLVIVTDRTYDKAWQTYLQGVAAEHPSNRVYLDDAVIRQSLPEPSYIYPLAASAPESVMVFPDAGCC
jgi:hypothetical protein